MMKFKLLGTTLALTVLMAGTAAIAMETADKEETFPTQKPPKKNVKKASPPPIVIPNKQVSPDDDQIENGPIPVPPTVVNKTPLDNAKSSWEKYMQKAYWNNFYSKNPPNPPTSPIEKVEEVRETISVAPPTSPIEKVEEVRETISVAPPTSPEPTENFSVEELTQSMLDLNLVKGLLATAKDNSATQKLAEEVLKKAQENRKNKQPIVAAKISETDKQQLSLFWRMLGYE